MVDDLIHRQESEIDRHQLSHGPQACHSRSGGCAYDNSLSNWGIAYALLAEFIQEAAGDCVSAAPRANFFPHYEDPLIADHLLPQCLADCLAICYVCH